MTTEENKVTVGNSFSISESGAIGISCYENPSLSIVYAGMDKPPVVLSDRKVFRSATFVKVSGKKYLAASCSEDGCLYLWDPVSETSNKVFDPKIIKEHGYKGANVFKINDSTVGYGEVYPSPDGSRRVFIFKTDTEKLTLYSMLNLTTPDSITEICYTEVEGTPFLLLCIPHGHRIMAVEIVVGQ